jgi:hypothetical protein
MRKKHTATPVERVDEGPRVVARRRTDRFVQPLVPPAVIGKDLRHAYQQMAEEEAREAEALEWAEATMAAWFADASQA